ncbi:MAG: N-acetyl-gamma-glutamyl-phosphate reductase [Bacteroidales bacterium]|nr:N-acetyl-gamma-glutamyl-phosphate reductase [Bacteroidales bacterium]
MQKKKIGIIGATGYTGSELVRILANHPHVEITVITSETYAGKKFSDVHSYLKGHVDFTLSSVEDLKPEVLDLVFLALPHGVSMDFVKKFQETPLKIIDLSGDFRLSDSSIYETWYQKKHSHSEGFKEAVFGSPELFSDRIKKARLIANPGCYPTSAILALAPLLTHKLIETAPIIVDSKSGVTGAGVKPKETTHFSNVHDNFKAYGLKNHRHTIEIEEIADKIAGSKTTIQFTPHLLPVDRGILTTVYARPLQQINEETVQNYYKEFYQNAPFVHITDRPPSIKDVRASNHCAIYATYDPRTNLIVAVSVIDNLVKGAAGQAIQNMNILFGWEETTGLNQLPIHP